VRRCSTEFSSNWESVLKSSEISDRSWRLAIRIPTHSARSNGRISAMASQTVNAVLQPEGIEVRGESTAGSTEILTPPALRFVAGLARRFEPTRRSLLQRRVERQQEIVDGKMPEFLPETAELRESDWKVAPIPADLRDRRVEITGPVDRKM